MSRPRRSPRLVRVSMLGLTVGALVLAGCGADETAVDPSGSPSGTAGSVSPSSSPPSPATAKVLRLLSGTAAGGQVDGTVVPLTTPAEVAAFVRQFRGHPLGTQVRRFARHVSLGPGLVLVGSVVAVGCDVPTEVAIGTTPLAMEAEPVPSPLPECLAPVTTVALAAVDPSLVVRVAD